MEEEDEDIDISAIYVLGKGKFDLGSPEMSEIIRRAMEKAAKEVRRKYKEAGVPMVIWKDGEDCSYSTRRDRDRLIPMSTYTAKIIWQNDSPESFTKNQYTRGHTWEFDGGVTVPASSSPHAVRVPFSVEAAVDPEEALVAAASSCHMLTFLWLASKAGFLIDSYEDNAVGEMTKDESGVEWMSKITLDPNIVWSGEKIPTDTELAELHHNAHKYCYIANSIKSLIFVSEPGAVAAG